jgi:hypothetical protein
MMGMFFMIGMGIMLMVTGRIHVLMVSRIMISMPHVLMACHIIYAMIHVLMVSHITFFMVLVRVIHIRFPLLMTMRFVILYPVFLRINQFKSPLSTV